ncbi:MAG: HAMP domain-containing histidine kinase [Oscillospiraceae bacterium]|nr:HAMP domain-containing histidine kinase [Oscillospiraceae bacterium]
MGLFSGKNRRLQEELQKTQEELKLKSVECEMLRKDSDSDLIHFHSAVSHAMRIPISIILGYADLLRGDLVTEEAVRREYLLKICDRVTYMNSLLNQLLADARSDTQLYEIITAPADITALIQRTASDIALAAAQKGINIKVNGAEDGTPIIIEADETQLTKGFYNILENSMKYMGRPGEINITVSRSDGQVLIVFKDDGKGLAEEELEHIFDMNYQGSNMTSGFGLGLHLAKLSVEAHKGKIFAKSGRDKGMGIYICLPEKL